MGITGVGKSSFISKVTGHDSGIGHDLTSCQCKHNLSTLTMLIWNEDTRGVEFYSMEVEGRLVYLVDTPGFNDTFRSDHEVLLEVAFVLSQIYREGMKLAGILYLHRISDNRVTGSALKNLNLLECMCGSDAASRVFFVTTMWHSTREEHDEEVLRESRLVSTREYWGRFCRYGSQTKRWAGTQSSAFLMIKALISLSDDKGYEPLLIQREIVDEGKSPKNTTAGQDLAAQYTAAENKLLSDLHSVQLEEPGSQSEISKLRKEIEGLRRAQRNLSVSTGSLFAEREEVYGKVLLRMRDYQHTLSMQLKEEMRKYRQLQDKIKSSQYAAEEGHGHLKKNHAKFHCSDEEPDMSENALRLRKRDVAKRNLVSFLGLLAGVGMTAAGTATGIIPLVGAGVGFAVTSASGMNLSRKIRGTRGEGPYGNDALASNSFTAASGGATISNLD
ncbi:uncharacterized protein N7479_001208 [Penicillium vulpinum]|uniref:uncharacterized protein n=1 Tax=Penicillium vulpinum TaxID=29845 RepID=UPI00254949B3|nr:uncharacterized protein N7479_001208 [Penicillium vulpinum]KAJ5971290.1 hypothetical protein N7479_001208 [Penicillium vulpinum]